MPELTTSLKSVLSNPPHPGIAVGNLIGSNIANMLLIIGMSAIVYPIKIKVAKQYKTKEQKNKGKLILQIFIYASIFIKHHVQGGPKKTSMHKICIKCGVFIRLS